MNKRIKLAAFVALTLITASGCKPEGGGHNAGQPGAKKVCDIRLSPPTTELLAGKAVVKAEAKSTCDVPPTSHKVQIWLEKELNGEWTLTHVPKGDAKGLCEEIAPTGAWISCSFRIFYCSPGKWRPKVLVTGTGPSGTPFAFSPDGPKNKAEARIVSCPKPKK